MTTLKNIDMKSFKAACAAARARAAEVAKYDSHEKAFAWTHRADLCEYFAEYAESKDAAQPEITEESVKSALRVAARAKQHLGATEKQISYLVSLAAEQGRLWALANITRLSKGEASIMIDQYLSA